MKILLKEKDQKLLSECKKLLKENPNIKKRKLHLITDLEKRLYYIKVWSITESQPLHVLRNHEKRCWKCNGGHHLDHIYPISMGFYNKIPPEVIGDIRNLRFIPIKDNIKKGYKITTESKNTLKKIIKRKKK
jgi:hypothetical protein